MQRLHSLIYSVFDKCKGYKTGKLIPTEHSLDVVVILVHPIFIPVPAKGGMEKAEHILQNGNAQQACRTLNRVISYYHYCYLYHQSLVAD